MFNISFFLEKFSKNIKNIEFYKEEIINIIKKQTELSLETDLIEIKDYIVYVKSSPGVKNKIFIYKDKILENISVSMPNLKIVDIR